MVSGYMRVATAMFVYRMVSILNMVRGYLALFPTVVRAEEDAPVSIPNRVRVYNRIYAVL